MKSTQGMSRGRSRARMKSTQGMRRGRSRARTLSTPKWPVPLGLRAVAMPGIGEIGNSMWNAAPRPARQNTEAKGYQTKKG